jgi:hypothetical protein
MSTRLLTFVLIGLAAVGGALAVFLYSNKGAHLELTGEILKVRILALSPSASVVVVDFRVSNPSDLPFVVRSVEMRLDPQTGTAEEGAQISKPDVENLFKYQKLLGPKYTDVLSIKDQVGPHQTMDRMTGARFELPEPAIQARKAIRVHIEELRGAVGDLVEKK